MPPKTGTLRRISGWIFFKLALMGFDERLQGLDAGAVQVLHDEIRVGAGAETAEAVVKIMRESVEGAFEKIFKDVPFKLKPIVWNSWGSRQPVITCGGNPGMRLSGCGMCP